MEEKLEETLLPDSTALATRPVTPTDAEGRSGNPRLLGLPPFSSGDVRHPTTRPLAERAARLAALLPVPLPARSAYRLLSAALL